MLIFVIRTLIGEAGRLGTAGGFAGGAPSILPNDPLLDSGAAPYFRGVSASAAPGARMVQLLRLIVTCIVIVALNPESRTLMGITHGLEYILRATSRIY